MCVNAKAYLSVDTDSDHNPVVTRWRVKLNHVLKATLKTRWHLERDEIIFRPFLDANYYEDTAMNYHGLYGSTSCCISHWPK